MYIGTICNIYECVDWAPIKREFKLKQITTSAMDQLQQKN
jgi:hypothetical protein